ncbi:MAG: hypothetical protein U9N73_06555, partial [Candidatus Auribacterota bacterium]|nr:hypothetical protein [Candidatus Auribacterota bacterium]
SKSGVVLTILIAYLAIIFIYAERFDYNFSGFACLGDRFAPRDIDRSQTIVLPGSRGYDGQFYYYAARDPFIRGKSWRSMDVPVYRYSRILYPWLAALLALGNSGVIPYTLVLVNLAGVLLGSYFILRWLQDEGMNLWYAIIYGLLSGFILCLLRDLAGPVAMGFLVGGLYFFKSRKYIAGALFLGAALLTREVVLIVPVVFFLFALFSRRPGKRISTLSLSFVPLIIWSGYLFSRFGKYPLREGRGNFGAPLAGAIAHGRSLLAIQGHASEKIYLAVLLVVCLLSLLLAIREVIRSKDELSISFLLFSLFPVFVTTSIWVEPWSYGRVFLPGAVLLMVNYISTHDRLYLVPLVGHLVLSGVIIWWVW